MWKNHLCTSSQISSEKSYILFFMLEPITISGFLFVRHIFSSVADAKESFAHYGPQSFLSLHFKMLVQ